MTVSSKPGSVPTGSCLLAFVLLPFYLLRGTRVATVYVYRCSKCGRKNYLADRIPPGVEWASCMYCHTENSLRYEGTEEQ